LAAIMDESVPIPEPRRKTRLPPPANEGEGVVAEKDLRELLVVPLIGEEGLAVSSIVGNSNEAAAPSWRSSAVGRDERTAVLLEDADARMADAAALAVAACMVFREYENLPKLLIRNKREDLTQRIEPNETISSTSMAHFSVDKGTGEPGNRLLSLPSDFVRLRCVPKTMAWQSSDNQ